MWIYRSANLLIRQLCDRAPIHAAMRADKLHEVGDMAGRATLRQILQAIGELRRTEPGAGERVQ